MSLHARLARIESKARATGTAGTFGEDFVFVRVATHSDLECDDILQARADAAKRGQILFPYVSDAKDGPALNWVHSIDSLTDGTMDQFISELKISIAEDGANGITT